MSLRVSLIVFQAAAVACLLLSAASAQDQGNRSSSSPGPTVVLTKLSPPTYPPLARQARINGDVKVAVLVRRDGTVESVDWVSGHPMLRQAAVDSARQSSYMCRGCGEAATSYQLVYTFAVSEACRFGPNCEPMESHAPQVNQSEDKITLTVEPTCECDPSTTGVGVRVRAAKCLYMWKCGFRKAEDK